MKIHPAVHLTWISAMVAWLWRIEWISDIVQKLYDKTEWMRDLIKWRSEKKSRKGWRKSK